MALAHVKRVEYGLQKALRPDFEVDTDKTSGQFQHCTICSQGI